MSHTVIPAADGSSHQLQELIQDNEKYKMRIVDLELIELNLNDQIQLIQEKFQIEKQQLNQNLQKKTEYANQLQEQLETIQQQFENFKQENQDTSKLFQNLKIAQDQLKEMKDQKNKINKNFDILKDICNNTDLGKTILKQFENKIHEENQQLNQQQDLQIQQQQLQDTFDGMQGYDLQIIFSSVKLLLKQGAEIKLKFPKDSPQYTNALSKNIHLVAFLGLKNAGKSYFHSKLSGQIIKQGNLHATQGLNISFTDKQWFLDSPGLGETLQNFTKVYEYSLKFEKISQEINRMSESQNMQSEEKQKYEDLIEQKKNLKNKIEAEKKKILEQQNELYKEKMALENFIQSFILTNADVIVYVCDILTLEEQRYITQISQQISKNQKKQKLIVCHNFKTIDTISDFEKCIEKDIYKNFSIELNEKIDLSKPNYKDFSVQDQITHVVFGKEGTEIERKYNQKSIDFINNELENLAKQGKTQNLFNSFKEYCTQNIQEYIIWKKLKFEGQQIQSQIEDQTPGQDNQIVEKVPNPMFTVDFDQNKILSNDHLCLDINNIFCKDILMDFLGQKINDFEGGENSCFYQVYKKDLSKSKTLKTILLSAPGYSMVSDIKMKVTSDKVKQLKILLLNIKYHQGMDQKLLQECKVSDKDLDQSHKFSQKLSFQDIKLQIPICGIEQNFTKNGENKSLEVQKLEQYSIFQINIEYSTDDSDSDF